MPRKKVTGPDDSLERAARRAGRGMVAGVDEAGRGPLAGPVVAAAVIVGDAGVPAGVNDSKKLTPKARERLAGELDGWPGLSFAVGIAEPEEIDDINILRATHLAMRRALDGLWEEPDFALVDGLPVEGLGIDHDGIVKGDGRSVSIAAASIFAKVARDRMMVQYDGEYPSYGFAKHKGYGTAFHLQMLKEHGACPIHRRSFRPVADSAVGEA